MSSKLHLPFDRFPQIWSNILLCLLISMGNTSTKNDYACRITCSHCYCCRIEHCSNSSDKVSRRPSCHHSRGDLVMFLDTYTKFLQISLHLVEVGEDLGVKSHSSHLPGSVLYPASRVRFVSRVTPVQTSSSASSGTSLVTCPQNYTISRLIDSG